jgi:hypothetical protein
LAGYRHWRRHPRRTKIAIAGVLSAQLLLAACDRSQPSVDQLRKVAHAIPLPAGLSFVGDGDHLQRPGDFGNQSQHQLALTYKTATPLDCGQLTDAWRTALKQARRKFHEDPAAPGEFVLNSGDITIILVTGNPGTQCSGAGINLGVQN